MGRNKTTAQKKRQPGDGDLAIEHVTSPLKFRDDKNQPNNHDIEKATEARLFSKDESAASSGTSFQSRRKIYYHFRQSVYYLRIAVKLDLCTPEIERKDIQGSDHRMHAEARDDSQLASKVKSNMGSKIAGEEA